jgi:hypothetical protein
MTDETAARGPKANIFSVTAMGMPDGGMITRAPGLARLIDALFDGRLLSPSGGRDDNATGPVVRGGGVRLRLQGGRRGGLGDDHRSGGSDPAVSATLVHHVEPATTIVVICNQDRGSWAATEEITAALGLQDPRP